jgi:dolichol-phosphate mannosyltransferase
MATWIVLPTYNEAETVASMVRALHAVSEADILIVDDNSPDGTGRIIDDLISHDSRLHVLHRPGKLGLGSAYRDGFRLALEQGATTVIQMDADGSHDPALIPIMVDRLRDLDMVLASRYIPGGSFPISWHRRWISTIGNVYIRGLLGWGVHDWSTGYKAWRGDFLRRIMREKMIGVGYAWLMEMTWLARRLGGRVGEVPLVFLERQGGTSKFSWRIAAEDLRLAWILARRRLPDSAPLHKG